MSTNPTGAASAWTDRASIPHFILKTFNAAEEGGRYIGMTEDFKWCRTGAGAAEEGNPGATRLAIWNERLISGQLSGWVRVTRAPTLAADGSMIHSGEWATLSAQGSQLVIRPVTEGLDPRDVGQLENNDAPAFDAGSESCFVCEPDGTLNVYNAAQPQSMSSTASRAASKVMDQLYGLGVWLEGMGWVANGSESRAPVNLQGGP